MAEEAQGKQMGQGCSSGKWDIGACNIVRKGPVNTLSHWKGNK